MFVGIIGTRSSGKLTIEAYLNGKGFISLRLVPPASDATQGDASEPSPLLNIKVGDSKHSIAFHKPGDMLDYATRNWRSHFVTISLHSQELLEPFTKRPFFLLLILEAPLMLRYRRRQAMLPNVPISLEEFVIENDMITYGKTSTNASNKSSLQNSINLNGFVHIPIINAFESVEKLYQHLDSINIMNGERLRPQWDSYFMTLASLASMRSNCMKRRVGALLVRNNRILATGYNGTPRGLRNCNEGGCARCNGKAVSGQALDECLCLHAEENALLEAGRERVGDGAVLYCNTCPCLRCSVKIVQTGVTEVVYNLSYSMDGAAADVFKAAGVKLRQHTPP